jgi:hypothetical protein
MVDDADLAQQQRSGESSSKEAPLGPFEGDSKV